MNLTSASKYLSLILRHKPETIGILLDQHGWADVDQVIQGISKTYSGFTLETLKEIVDTDNKQRYSFNSDYTKIRANQGHSVKVDIELKESNPPEFLYHGTAERFTNSIKAEGLKPMGRLYVHLSTDIDMAHKVGSRHGNPRVFCVDAKRMKQDGYKFLLSENGVWLTEKVPPEYLFICLHNWKV